MRLPFALILAGVLAALIWLGVTLVNSITHAKRAAPLSSRSPAAILASSERSSADAVFASTNPKIPEKAYSEFIERHADDADPGVQDEVASARIRIGYVLAKSHKYEAASKVLKQAEASYKGTGMSSPDFGGLKDQAAYQSAVCLSAAGKKEEARQAFIQFFKDYQLSPLVHAVRRRLIALNGGKSTSEIDALVETAVEKQQEHAQLEMSSCGPRAIFRLLNLLGKNPPAIEEIGRRCKSTNQGTTLAGMQKGLSSFGLNSYGYELNRTDFESVPLPALWLSGDHYVVVEGFGVNSVRVYDPLYKSDRSIDLKSASDSNFTAVVLTIAKMSVGENQ